MAPEAQTLVAPSTYFSAGAADPDAPRTRVCRAVVELLAARGYEGTTLKMVLERAEVTAAEFEREFQSIEAASLAAYDEMTGYYVDLVERSFRQTPGGWRDKLRAAGYTAARCFRDNPVDSRFGAYEMMRVSDLAQTRREATLEFFVEMVDAGREEMSPRASVTRSTAESTIGAVMGAVIKQITAKDRRDPAVYVPQFMYVAVRPYLGTEAAEEELTIPPPPDEDLRVR